MTPTRQGTDVTDRLLEAADRRAPMRRLDLLAFLVLAWVALTLPGGDFSTEDAADESRVVHVHGSVVPAQAPTLPVSLAGTGNPSPAPSAAVALEVQAAVEFLPASARPTVPRPSLFDRFSYRTTGPPALNG